MIRLSYINRFERTTRYFTKLLKMSYSDIMHKYGKIGVERLKIYTPKDTGLTANSWSYEVKKNRDVLSLSFKNSNVNNGVPIAIIIQYGHGTKNGGYVAGVDYINPALKPVFEDLKNELIAEVKRVE